MAAKHPRPLTGRTVLLCLVGFFAIVALANAIMINAAVSTFSGVETSSSYQAGLAFERDAAAAHAQDELHWQVQANVRSSPRARSWSRSTRAMRRAARSPASRHACSCIIRPIGRADQTVAVSEDTAGHFRGTHHGRGRPAGADDRIVARRRAVVPLAKPRRPAVERDRWPKTLDLALFVQHRDGTAHMDLAVEGVGCAGCIRKIEGRAEAASRRRRGAAQLHQSPSRGRLARRRACRRRRDRGARSGSAIRRTRSSPSAPRPKRRSTCAGCSKCLAVAGFAAMNIMLLSVSVWSGNADMTPQTRDFFHWLSALIALPAAAYAGQPFFHSALARHPHAPAQHGRADLARRDPRARHVAGRDREPCAARLFRFRRDAAVLPAVRALCSIMRCGARRARSPAIWRR